VVDLRRSSRDCVLWMQHPAAQCKRHREHTRNQCNFATRPCRPVLAVRGREFCPFCQTFGRASHLKNKTNQRAAIERHFTRASLLGFGKGTLRSDFRNNGDLRGPATVRFFPGGHVSGRRAINVTEETADTFLLHLAAAHDRACRGQLLVMFQIVGDLKRT